MKTKKRQKNTRHRGTHTHAGGAKKRRRGKGHRGGIGNAGTGKRADHKKNLALNPFGKARTLRAPQPTKLKTINLRELSDLTKSKKEINLVGYKILGVGELTVKVKIIASQASSSALDKVKKAGSEIVLN